MGTMEHMLWDWTTPLLTLGKQRQHSGMHWKARTASCPDSTEDLECLTKGWKEQVE